MTAIPTPYTSNIIEVDKALESMRDAGFDLTAAVGEPVDNSIEASATIIRIEPRYAANKSQITDIAFADNGRGIELETLAQVLKMGYSTRYGQRGGLGRFGVGLKLAALSVGKRIEVITRPFGQEKFYRSYIDLDLISSGEQELIQAEEVGGWPAEYAELMVDAKGEPFVSGTLVLWQKIDRLANGGNYGRSIDARIAELRKFLARAYRKFIDNGLQIVLDGKTAVLHDPTFLLDDPRIEEQYGLSGLEPDRLKGTVIQETDIDINGEKVHVVVTVAPEIFRHHRGAGGAKDFNGRDIREFQINTENEGRISFLRNGREIYYDIVPRMLQGGVTRGDRYIGIEVSFPAELDEFFQVRHVKRGAEPMDKLRDKLRLWLERPVKVARNRIRDHWSAVEEAEEKAEPVGGSPLVQGAVETAEKTMPRGNAGAGMTAEEEQGKVNEIIEDLGLDEEVDGTTAQRVRDQIMSHPLTIVDTSWPGKEMLEIEHLNGKAVVRLNHRHPFLTAVYGPLRASALKPVDEQDPADLHALILRSADALEAMFLAYAKAENMQHNPEQFEDLRSYWGQHLSAYMKEILRVEDI
ncbi:ATP-binding protein [Microbacterium invictum]|uniref:Histidine kinase/HSP90-like ATPase domain-containing protein n=1 Tax=Microbacterium invictum TaxID=515415 RepID=A0AA40VMF8_9MICO|nr:ATP-binding protein [Microbacterium invictum]MBB4140414.1 hypothetical protein [Microbacterium invictum]